MINCNHISCLQFFQLMGGICARNRNCLHLLHLTSVKSAFSKYLNSESFGHFVTDGGKNQIITPSPEFFYFSSCSTTPWLRWDAAVSVFKMDKKWRKIFKLFRNQVSTMLSWQQFGYRCAGLLEQRFWVWITNLSSKVYFSKHKVFEGDVGFCLFFGMNLQRGGFK